MPAITRYDRGVDPVDQIVDVGRRTRKKPSRAMWIVAAVIGAACAIAFVAIFVGSEGDGTPGRPVPAHPEQGLTFSTGLVIGLAVGVLVGVLIARQQRSDHSSRKSP